MMNKVADAIWHGGVIETMDGVGTQATGFAVCDGKILAVGRDADVLNLAGAHTKIHNLHGRYVLPGLVESHTHALWGACRELFDVYVGYEATLQGLLDAVRVRAASLSPGMVVHGGPWRQDMRDQIDGPPRLLLDSISDVHPIILADTSQHVMWCNTLALELSGIRKGTPDIAGGVIERDSGTGEPNGILAETAGAGTRKLLDRSPQQLAEACQMFVGYFHGMGITAFKEPMAFEPDMQAYKAADDRGELNLHMGAHLVRSSPLGTGTVPYDALEDMRTRYATANIRTGFAKLFLDGVPLGLTGSFIDPYMPESGYDVAGHDPDATLLISPGDLKDTVSELDRRGFVTKMHAVGDNAIRKGLDAIEAARTRNGNSDLRHEISHSNFISDADVPRFAQLNAIAEMSPKLWFPGPTTAVQMKVIGAARMAKSHRMKDLLHAGAELTYASDWPAAAPDANPWIGMAGMISRRNATGLYDGAVAPEQAITLDQALPLFTTNGARSLGMEGEIGAVIPGCWANFIILDRDLHDCSWQDIGATQVRETYWKGQLMHAL